MAKAFWDIEVSICEIELNDKNKIIVKNVSKKGKDYVDVRKYFTDNEVDWKPAKGIVIPMDKAEEVADVIRGAVKEKLPF